METQLKYTNHLKSGLVFGLLTILFFLFHLFVEIPANNDPSIQYSIDTGAVVLEQNALFIFLAGVCSLFFAISFAKYSVTRYPGVMGEASGVFIIMKAISLLLILFYAVDHQSLFYFILNGLAVLSGILTFFFFAMVFVKLKLPAFLRFFPIFCLFFSTGVFFLTSIMPNMQIDLCRNLNDLLNIVFVGFLSYFMWRCKAKA
ncbi:MULTISPECIES: hypothetical protein [unclassified Enterococcus]|jgi:hypothetical protein|uniref:hypothetical protein n=1 Tax=unclassified Enterococcus TaxID=2608891 RepID=UPI00035457F6|nr:hypothetical protein D920_02875 [Enterococcus faecalis 13-SD-W-01]